jgi:hypothetical protein
LRPGRSLGGHVHARLTQHSSNYGIHEAQATGECYTQCIAYISRDTATHRKRLACVRKNDLALMTLKWKNTCDVRLLCTERKSKHKRWRTWRPLAPW